MYNETLSWYQFFKNTHNFLLKICYARLPACAMFFKNYTCDEFRKIKYKKTSGFTLLEMLLSVSVLGLLAGIATPIYQSFLISTDLDVARSSVVQSLRRAQTLAVSGMGDNTWGVYLVDGDITIFQGVNFAGRVVGFDEVTDVPASIVPSGVSEVVFSKLEGVPNATGTITLTSNTNETRNITINAKGMVDF